MPEKITRENFTAAMERAVQEMGEDHIYEQHDDGECFYFHPETGEPDCIVGHALSYLGYGPDDVVDAAASVTLPALGVEDDVLIAAARMAQITQDGGFPWSEALAEYHAVLTKDGV